MAEEWSGYRGPGYDGVSNENIRMNWLEEPPLVLWRVPMRNGFSSITTGRGKVFTLVERTQGVERNEMCVALDAATGQEVWAVRVDTASQYDGTGISGAFGPRSTPVVFQDRVYVLSAYLRLFCLNADTGAVVWMRDLVAEYGSSVIPWQSAAAPLVEGDRVFVMARAGARSLLAFDRHSGAEAWARHSDAMTHATPIAVTLGGVRQVIFYTQTGFVAVKPESGDVLWRYSIRYNHTSAAASPVIASNMIYCSRAYPASTAAGQAGALVAQVSHAGGVFSASQRWFRVNQLMNHWATPVERDGYLYGIYGQYNSGASSIDLKCLEMATGTEKWSVSLSAQGSRSGGLVLVGGKVLLQAENGELILFEADSSAYTEIARFKALAGRSWNPPAISNGRIYARSTTEAVCLDVALKARPRLGLEPGLAQQTGLFELQILNEDQSPLDASRIPGIEIYTAADPGLDPALWTRLNIPGVLTNGRLRIEDPDSKSVPRRFFRIQERP